MNCNVLYTQRQKGLDNYTNVIIIIIIFLLLFLTNKSRNCFKYRLNQAAECILGKPSSKHTPGEVIAGLVLSMEGPTVALGLQPREKASGTEDAREMYDTLACSPDVAC